jgi:hypothetical protein
MRNFEVQNVAAQARRLAAASIQPNPSDGIV